MAALKRAPTFLQLLLMEAEVMCSVHVDPMKGTVDELALLQQRKLLYEV